MPIRMNTDGLRKTRKKYGNRGAWLPTNRPAGLLTTGEVARILGCAMRTAHKYAENGTFPGAYKLPAVRKVSATHPYSGDWRIPISGLWEFADKNKIQLPAIFARRSLLITAMYTGDGPTPEQLNVIEYHRFDNALDAYALMINAIARVQFVVGLDAGRHDAVKLISAIQGYNYTPVMVLEDDISLEQAQKDFPELIFTHRPVNWDEVLAPMKELIKCTSKTQKG